MFLCRPDGGKRRAGRMAAPRTSSRPWSPVPGAASLSVELQHERRCRPRAPAGGCRGVGERGQHCIELQAARLPRDLSKGDRATRTARIERPEGGETSEGWRRRHCSWMRNGISRVPLKRGGAEHTGQASFFFRRRTMSS
jgi:hypothetical protein